MELYSDIIDYDKLPEVIKQIIGDRHHYCEDFVRFGGREIFSLVKEITKKDKTVIHEILDTVDQQMAAQK
ncbi:hypothetical protein ACTXT7_013176 [Hymenolepis weldensis]